MKKGQEFTGTVMRIDFPNKGIVQTEEGTVTVKNTIPGRTIRGVINKKRGDKVEGRQLELVSRAPEEVCEGVCRHFEICGGCQYQSLPYEKQLELKADQIKRMLDAAVKTEYTYEGIFASPSPDGYRNKMEYTFGDAEKGGPLEVGMHRRGSMFDIETVEDCRIADADFARVLTGTLDFFRKEGTPFYHRMSHVGVLRHLLVRKSASSGQILVDLITSSQEREKTVEFLERYTEFLKGLEVDGVISGILHTWNDSVADAVINQGTDILYGSDEIEEVLFGLKFRITPFSFFQTNSKGAEVLYGKVREYVGDTKDAELFDLYSGTGTIAQILAPVASKVTGIEIVPEAVEAAKQNAVDNGLSNCEFLAGDVLAEIDRLKDQKPDIIVLDPPRDGINPKALGKILEFGAKRMIYISCKPTSLARDLGPIQLAGYRVLKACSVDMFPSTGNTEAIALLEKED